MSDELPLCSAPNCSEQAEWLVWISGRPPVPLCRKGMILFCEVAADFGKAAHGLELNLEGIRG